MSALTMLLSLSLQLINPVEDSLKSYFQGKYPELCVTQKYHLDEVAFFREQKDGLTFVGASVDFKGIQPEMYAVIVQTEQKDKIMKQAIDLFEKAIDETELRCFQISSISNNNGQDALVIIWER